MEYFIGLVLALIVLGGSTFVGFDRERVFYPAVMLVVASYYALFAVMAASTTALVLECVAAVLFTVIAVIGFKTRLWFVAVALAGHGVFDFFHHYIIQNPGVPEWWPGFCMAFDIAAAGYLVVLLIKRPALTA